MKISAWAKAKGDTVWFGEAQGTPDKIWLSCVFTWNRQRAESALSFLALLYPGAEVRKGGTGFDWGKPRGDPSRSELPPEIEWIAPDYSLYNDDRAVGFFLRGCNRACGFCDVPLKEGRIQESLYWPLNEWCPDGLSKVLALDNNMAMYSDQVHDRLLAECRSTGRRLSITQGYDIRVIAEKPYRAQVLAEDKPWDLKFRERTLYIAWDYMGIERAVRKGIEALLDAGFKGREITCFTIVGFEQKTYHPNFDDYLHRHDILWGDYGVHPFVMVFNHQDDPKLRALARWTNRKIFKSKKASNFEDYLRGPDARLATEADFDPLEAYGLGNEVGEQGTR
jgi:hypothetical protein